MFISRKKNLNFFFWQDHLLFITLAFAERNEIMASRPELSYAFI